MTVRPVRSMALGRIPRLRHGFFTREGGVSSGPFAGLNCGYGNLSDARDNIEENRARAVSAIGLSPDRLRTVRQVHGTTAVRVEDSSCATELPEADAVVASSPGIAVGVLTADCAPVLFADAETGVVAAAHAGWRGALGGILESALEAMEKEGAVRGRILAAVGPAISAAAYEVGTEFRDRFLAEDPPSSAYFRGGGEAAEPLRFDLPGYVVYRLAALGLGCIENLGHCTYRDESRYFSHRRSRHREESDHGLLLSVIVWE